MKLQTVMTVVACLLITSAAFAQRNQLRAGSSAPELNVDTWVKGTQTTIQDDNVYVIAFWATWCPPCRATIPMLSDLQDFYEPDGLRIIGVSTEEERTVREFVDRQGSQIRYTIAVDNNNATNRAWQGAAGINTIPSAYIVDGNGRIQYIGNPSNDEFVRVLELVMTGRFDARLFRESEGILNAADSARRMRNWRQAFSLYDQVIEVDTHVFAPLELTKFEIMIVDMEDTERAYAHARRLMSRYSDDPSFLVSLAQKIATDAQIPNDKRDLDLAMEVIEKATEKGRSDDPRLLAARAQIHFHRGEFDRAISLQRRAWMIAVPARKAGYERVLRNYQEAANRGAARTGESRRTDSPFR